MLLDTKFQISDLHIIANSEKGLNGLESIPFYLIQLTIIYAIHNSLPNKSKLMDELITLRLKWDSIKYDSTTDYSLDEQRVEILN